MFMYFVTVYTKIPHFQSRGISSPLLSIYFIFYLNMILYLYDVLVWDEVHADQGVEEMFV